jgi:hypothetical protein
MREFSAWRGAMIEPGPFLPFVILIVSLGTSVGQQSVAPTSSLTPTPSATISNSPTPSAASSLSASPSATPAPAPTRSVRISFVPPPLDGTISLGVFDSTGNLVRVLHQQASLDAFTVGADALITKWDGKNDYGQDEPPGKYHARGYTVGPVQIHNSGSDSSQPPVENQKVTIKLMANPLVKNERPSAELTAGFDDTDSFIKTTDQLPLYIISERTDISGIAMAKIDEKSADVWQTSGAGIEHFRISKLDQMMAFDCGAFDLE